MASVSASPCKQTKTRSPAPLERTRSLCVPRSIVCVSAVVLILLVIGKRALAVKPPASASGGGGLRRLRGQTPAQPDQHGRQRVAAPERERQRAFERPGHERGAAGER